MSDEADIVTIVSSDLIATVMEEYFNKKMYRQKVKIVELKPTEAGYSFFLQFAPKEKPAEKTRYDHLVEKVMEKMPQVNGIPVRDTKGKFTKKV